MKSIWEQDIQFQKKPSLRKDIKTDILIIGAGMAGLLTAYYLQELGYQPVVIEAKQICSGQTSRTTAKITAQHHLIYQKILKNYGLELTSQYAHANLEAIDDFEKIIQQNNINCDFKRESAFIYTLKHTQNLEQELQAAEHVHIPAFLTKETTLPFSINGALCFPDQAQFHPLKFIGGIIKDLCIYEYTPAQKIDTDKMTVYTPHNQIKAEHIVIATHYPFINYPGNFYLKLYQQRSYVAALTQAAQMNGMYLNENNQGYSFRNAGNYLLIGGENHRTGENSNRNCYENLKKAAQEFYPQSNLWGCWAAQDCIPLDGIPYIGTLSASTPNIFVATGFNKWGMTSSMVSAKLIGKAIAKQDYPYQDVFSPRRHQLSASTKNFISNSTHTAKDFAHYLSDFPNDIDPIHPGEGKIIRRNNQLIGIYRNTDNKLFAVSPKCPHLGCLLKWNPDDKTWDCPCHGSRFSYDGQCLDNPAQEDLTVIEKDMLI